MHLFDDFVHMRLSANFQLLLHLHQYTEIVQYTMATRQMALKDSNGYFCFSVLFCYAFMHVCLLMPCGHLLGLG